LAVLPGPNDQNMFGDSPNGPSPETRRIIDIEVRKIVDDCYTFAKAQLKEHRGQLNSLTQALLKSETLDEIDAYAAAGVPPHERVQIS
jgi:cell division protease FtsH